MRYQMEIVGNKKTSLEVAKRMFARRFPNIDLSNKTLKQMMGMEGYRIRALYEEKAKKYGVNWKGRLYTPGKIDLSDITNKILTVCNSALYGIICSCIYSMGFSPRSWRCFYLIFHATPGSNVFSTFVEVFPQQQV